MVVLAAGLPHLIWLNVEYDAKVAAKEAFASRVEEVIEPYMLLLTGLGPATCSTGLALKPFRNGYRVLVGIVFGGL